MIDRLSAGETMGIPITTDREGQGQGQGHGREWEWEPGTEWSRFIYYNYCIYNLENRSIFVKHRDFRGFWKNLINVRVWGLIWE